MRASLADGWLHAFRLWIKQWTGGHESYRPHMISPEYHAAYKLGFRAGWRAAMQSSRRFR